MTAPLHVDHVLADAEEGAQDVLTACVALVRDLCQDTAPWEWWVDEWNRNGWSLRIHEHDVRLEKTEPHSRDARTGEIGVPCGRTTFANAERAMEHIRDVVLTVDAHRNTDPDERRICDWQLALAATAHPDGSVPSLVALPSPFGPGMSQLPHQSDDDPPPPGDVSRLLAAAPSAIVWSAGGWNGTSHMSVFPLQALCGAQYDIDPLRDPMATLRALERAWKEAGGRSGTPRA